MNKHIITILVAGLLALTVPCSAEQVAYEPEDGGGASFSTHDYIDNRIISMDFYYTHYVTSTNDSEYWLRVSCSGSRVKLLDHISLIIDGERTDIQAIKEPSEKYVLAGYSLIDNKNHGVPFAGFIAASRGNTRFYPITAAQVEKLKTAQKVKVVLDTTKAINMKFDITPKFLASINKMNQYQLADLAQLWQPNDQHGYDRKD